MKAEAPISTEILELSQDFIDLCSPSPKWKLKPGKSVELMSSKISVLSSVDSDSNLDCIEVVTPVRRKFTIADPDGSKFKIESPDGSQFVIDLCTPNQGSVSPINLRKIKVEKPDAPHVIDIRTPEPKATPADTKPCLPGQRPRVEVAPGIVRLGAVFHSWEEARDAVYAREEHLGHQWGIGQSKMDDSGNRKKVTFRCNCYRQHLPVHSVKIDPADHRKGKSIRTSCEACVNVNRVHETGMWNITLVEWEHNHGRKIPEGGSIRRPATKEQKVLISQLANATTQQFSRGQIAEVLKAQIGDCNLEPRQIGNVMGQARQEARAEVERLGGDSNAIIDYLRR
ncbi:hypothetical protein BYT27DRAFT_7080897, partial [Phlegmacium glaucopus]